MMSDKIVDFVFVSMKIYIQYKFYVIFPSHVSISMKSIKFSEPKRIGENPCWDTSSFSF